MKQKKQNKTTEGLGVDHINSFPAVTGLTVASGFTGFWR